MTPKVPISDKRQLQICFCIDHGVVHMHALDRDTSSSSTKYRTEPQTRVDSPNDVDIAKNQGKTNLIMNKSSATTTTTMMNPSGYKSSIYPLHPPGSRVIVKVGETELTLLDRVMVATSSLFIVGSVVWVPAFYVWAYRKWRSIPKHDTRRRTLYATLVLAFTGIIAYGPQHSAKIGKLLHVRKWRLWKAWIKFIALEIIADQPGGGVSNNTNNSNGSGNTNNGNDLDQQTDQAMFAFVPHGIVPFPIAFAVLPEIAQRAFGIFRPVVATATALFPFVRDILMWVDSV
jgi:hypothetical protein